MAIAGHPLLLIINLLVWNYLMSILREILGSSFG